MIEEGFALMAAGMTVVFSFLVLLVLALYFLAWFFERFAHLFPEDAPEAAKASGGGVTTDDTPTRVAVAVAAAYRARQG